MKSTVTTNNKFEQPAIFPALYIHIDDLDRDDPMVYLMVDSDTGMLVSDNIKHDGSCENFHVGYYNINIDFHDFVLFTGTVTLSN